MHDSTEQFIIIPFEVDLDASVADKFTWVLLHPIRVQSVSFVYTEATDGAIATPGAVSFDTIISGGARTEKGAYTAQISQAVGVSKAVYSGASFVMDVGDTLFFEHKTQQTSTEAGKGVFILKYETLQD